MQATRMFGVLFVVLFALELIGALALRSLHATQAARGAIDPAIPVLGTAWVLGVWVAYIFFMMFLIGWVGEHAGADRVIEIETPRPTEHERSLPKVA
jgi:hypothetical protein